MGNNFPHPYKSLICNISLNRVIYEQSRAFWMSYILHTTLWAKQTIYHTDWSQKRRGFILGGLFAIFIRNHIKSFGKFAIFSKLKTEEGGWKGQFTLFTHPSILSVLKIANLPKLLMSFVKDVWYSKTQKMPKISITMGSRRWTFRNYALFKDTWYLWGKNTENMQLLDVLVYNLANKPSFQNPTKRHFTQCSIDGKSAVTF